MKLARHISLSLLPPLALATALGACAGRGASGIEVTGTGGSGGTSCKTTVCAAPVLNPLLLAVEINPAAGSGASFTERPNQDLDQSYGPVSLAADALVAVTATFKAPSDTPVPVPSSASILLDVPSAILGRPDLTFQASASVSASSSATAQLAIPEGLITNMAAGTLSLIPLPPADQQSPPYSSAVVLSQSMLSAGGLVASLPSDNFLISGVLLDSFQKAPNPAFVARAFQGGNQVSSATITGTDGSFLLDLPAAVGKAGTALTIQLSPESANDPLFVFDSRAVPNPLPTTLSIGTVKLAPYQKPPNQFNLTVQTTDAPPVPVGGAIVQMQTNLGPSNSTAGQPPYTGSTQFTRSATTDSKGTASFSLLPGNANAAIAYAAVVVPPPGSPYATTCQSVEVGAGVTGVSTPSAPAIGPVSVSARPVMSGKVTDSDGHPVAGVAITATPGTEAVSGCTATTAARASTTTDSQGNYALALDPGATGQPVHYQLEFDPPVGASVPRYTLAQFPVDDSAATISNNVKLPVGGLVAGTVTDSSQVPIPLQSATVRLFKSQCSSTPCSTPPSFRGQAVTDVNGYFQIVVPLIP